MTKVQTLKEAFNWFMRNHEGTLVCSKDGEEKEVTCYPEAKEFYGEQE